MARYYFESDDGPLMLGVTQEISSDREAKFEAVGYLEDLLRDVSGYFWEQDSISINVTNLDEGAQFSLILHWIDATRSNLRVVS